jgi:hypothetical protein
MCELLAIKGTNALSRLHVLDDTVFAEHVVTGQNNFLVVCVADRALNAVFKFVYLVVKHLYLTQLFPTTERSRFIDSSHDIISFLKFFELALR